MRPQTSQTSLRNNSGIRITNIDTVRSYSSQAKLQTGMNINPLNIIDDNNKKSGIYTMRISYLAKQIENPSLVVKLNESRSTDTEKLKFRQIDSTHQIEDTPQQQNTQGLATTRAGAEKQFLGESTSVQDLESHRVFSQATTARRPNEVKENNFFQPAESTIQLEEQKINIFEEAAALQTLSQQSMTIQYKDGKIIPYSIVGKPEWFNSQKQRIANSSTSLVPNLQNNPSKSNPNLFDNSILTESKLGASQQFNVNFQNNLQSPSEFLEDKQEALSQTIYDNLSVSINTTSKAPPSSSNLSRTDNRQSAAIVHPQKQSKYIEQEITKEELHREMETILQRLEHNAETNLQFNTRMLGTMGKGQQLVMTKFDRANKNYQQTLHYWEKEIERVSRKIDRNASESVLNQAESFRNQMEILRKLELTDEDHKRYGERFYQMSLRVPMNPLLDPQIQVIEELEGKYLGTKNAKELKQFEIIRRPQTHHTNSNHQNDPPFQSFQSNCELDQKIADKAQFFNQLNQCDPEMLDELQIIGKNQFQSEAQVFMGQNNNNSPVTYQQLTVQLTNEQKNDYDDIILSKWNQQEIRRLDYIGPQELPQQY